MRERESSAPKSLGKKKKVRYREGREKIIKILNTHVAIIIHICTVTVAIVYLYTSLQPTNVDVFFGSKCAKLITFFILHIYASTDGML